MHPGVSDRTIRKGGDCCDREGGESFRRVMRRGHAGDNLQPASLCDAESFVDAEKEKGRSSTPFPTAASMTKKKKFP